MVFIFALSLFFAPTGAQNEQKYEMSDGSCFSVHYIDVGQADSALIICKGEAMLIDGGNVADSQILKDYLKKLGIANLKYVIASHAHEDHVGGLSGALEQAKTSAAFSPVNMFNSKAFRNFVRLLQEQGVNLTIPEGETKLILGMSEVNIFAQTKKHKKTNNTSMMVKVIHQDNSFLFTGDIEAESERDFVEKGYNLKADVLKVSHHGSATSSSEIFLNSVNPQYAVISVGKNNSYRHPSDIVITRLDLRKIKVYRTDQQGTIIIKSDGKKVMAD
ncbi:MAG: MBL fold metallo-hydrolase [Elusimicrobiota bacterium]|nr:MBL fold metallo-hydrolase [Elusimicrobiota bacterium]